MQGWERLIDIDGSNSYPTRATTLPQYHSNSIEITYTTLPIPKPQYQYPTRAPLHCSKLATIPFNNIQPARYYNTTTLPQYHNTCATTLLWARQYHSTILQYKYPTQIPQLYWAKYYMCCADSINSCWPPHYKTLFNVLPQNASLNLIAGGWLKALQKVLNILQKILKVLQKLLNY